MRDIARAVGRFSICVVAASLASGCSTNGDPAAITSSPSSSTPIQTIRQTDDAGLRLPFDTDFPNRWSINNDGSPYEPCTQVPTEVLRNFGLNPSSVSDAAASDFQTARGCEWTFVDDNLSAISQYVGDIVHPQDGLDGHKALNSSGTEWFSDLVMQGRRVLVGSIAPSDCAVYVRSGDAVVVTSVIKFGGDAPSTAQICREAADFLKSTISRIPE
ncbi:MULTISPECIES: DUF3558 family protein [Gordonia]|uniref:DUF3558 family protein n=1 Tax=Gordonia TaxID=2053 RepID=UPI001EF0D80E|nr:MULTISPECIES: DUF3558 family protein [Gordonia]UPG66351.1 DUF3558 domain-containing protein [Gordonia hongkongensis]